jgi:hypothetical protein
MPVFSIYYVAEIFSWLIKLQVNKKVNSVTGLQFSVENFYFYLTFS